MDEKKVKFGFGISETECFTDTFDTVEELIAFAKDAYEHPDGNYWDEDWAEDEYPDVIWVGIIEEVSVTQFAPSLDDIADQITDKFYCEHNVDDDDVCHVYKREDAEREWKAFIEKYFELPSNTSVVINWNIGRYDLKAREWVEIFDSFNDELIGELKK